MTGILALGFLASAVFSIQATSSFIRVKRWGGDHSDDPGSMFRGTAGVDYPNYKTIPLTSFKCSDDLYPGGLYADVETQCQVYHICQEGRKDSFLCGKGTVFNQQILACDYWYSTECENAPNYYYLNAQIGQTQSKPVDGFAQKPQVGSGPSLGINTPRLPQKKPGNQGISGLGGHGQNNQRNQGQQRPQIIGGNSGLGQQNKPSHGRYGQNQHGTFSQKPGQHGSKKIVGGPGQYIPESNPGDTGYYNPESIPGDSGQYKPAAIPGDSGQYQPAAIPGDSGQYNPQQIPGGSGQYYPKNLPGESGQPAVGRPITQGQYQPNRPHTRPGGQNVPGQSGNPYHQGGYPKSSGQHQVANQGSTGYQSTYPIAQRPPSGQQPQVSRAQHQQDRNQFGNNAKTTGISSGTFASSGQQNQGHNRNIPGSVTAQRPQSGPWSFPNGGMMMMGGPGDR